MISFTPNQIFLVTGASSGIGEGVAKLLNELGATVVGIARNQERLEKVKSECKYPENMHIEIKDLVEDIDGLPKYVKSLKDKYGKLTGLAYCAGVCQVNPLQTLDYAEMKYLFDIDYFAPIFMAKGFADRRINIGEGASMVFISSQATTILEGGMTTYAGAKAALSASARVIASELLYSKVRVNCISPGNINTSMSGNRELEKIYAFGFGEVEDAAKLMVFLLSDAAKWITKQDYILDCGHH